MKVNYMTTALATVFLLAISGVRSTNPFADDTCTPIGQKCSIDTCLQSTCCRQDNTYCGLAHPNDTHTKCIPYVAVGKKCSKNGVDQQGVCEEGSQCIPSKNGKHATCQVTPSNKIYCGRDSRTEPNQVDVNQNHYCPDSQYCALAPSTQIPTCYEYIEEGGECTIPPRSWVGQCQEGLICMITGDSKYDTATCVPKDECIENNKTGCYFMNSACCSDTHYCGVRGLETESSCIRYRSVGEIGRQRKAPVPGNVSLV